MTTRAKNITYWITTILVAFFIGSGGIVQMAILRVDAATQLLGYPLYFFHILGFWKILGAIAILVPRYPRLKEWAYAGIIFDLTGAAASNAAVGGYGAYGFHILAPLIIAALTIASWYLRPETRKIGILIPAKTSRPA